MDEMAHAGRVITLDAPASQNLVLQGTGPIEMNWAPRNKEAGAVEIRARIVSASGVLGSVPIVRWFTEVGHGGAVWREPQPSLALIIGTPMLNYSLPARGMIWRTTARQFKIGFAGAGTLSGGALETATIQVSALPAYGAHTPQYPYQHMAFPTASVQQPFPMAAREWRLRDSAGQPLALGAASILFTGVMGALFGALDAALFADFGPIPHDAASFTASALMYADYR